MKTAADFIENRYRCGVLQPAETLVRPAGFEPATNGLKVPQKQIISIAVFNFGRLSASNEIKHIPAE